MGKWAANGNVMIRMINFQCVAGLAHLMANYQLQEAWAVVAGRRAGLKNVLKQAYVELQQKRGLDPLADES